MRNACGVLVFLGFFFPSVYGFHILMLVWHLVWSESFHYGQITKTPKWHCHKELGLGLMSLTEETTSKDYLLLCLIFSQQKTFHQEISLRFNCRGGEKNSINFVSGNQWFKFQSFLGASLFFISLSGLRNKLPIYFVIWFTGCWFEI